WVFSVKISSSARSGTSETTSCSPFSADTAQSYTPGWQRRIRNRSFPDRPDRRLCLLHRDAPFTDLVGRVKHADPIPDSDRRVSPALPGNNRSVSPATPPPPTLDFAHENRLFF